VDQIICYLLTTVATYYASQVVNGRGMAVKFTVKYFDVPARVSGLCGC